MQAPRVRFAPAPTGYLHVGSARSALFNWLFARRHGGAFVLRVEDTDESKKSQEFVDAIVEPLRWLGLDWDEGPYFQSQRKHLYEAAIQKLVDGGRAYYCDLSAADSQRLAAEAGLREGYHGWSRDRDVADGDGVVVRFRVPDEGSTVIEDLIRGRVEVAHDTIADFVIRRGDGSPVFFLANAVDDHDMGISHVIRGEDLLNTTPKVKLLWEALGYGPTPAYAHLPLLVNERRQKLAKRRDSVALSEFKAEGYLPEALLNALALLGWGPPDAVEIRPMEEIVSRFSLEAVNKGSAYFDLVKLKHINNAYIKALTPVQFVAAAEPWLPEHYDLAVVEALAVEVQQRISTLSEAAGWLDWLFVDEISEYDEKSWAKAMVKGRAADRVLAELAGVLETVSFDDPATLESCALGVGNRLSEELGARVMSQAPLRVAVTGRGAGIPLWEALTHLGKERTLSRVAAARSRLAG
ncbi:MAG: glutamate--tRNA ligase [Acidimicrobiaceae bacterium]|nr:glutamate--tRNA ligase [Acidimicrobiia bacterium]MCY4494711.1 glutamate--tRNA ligase [Acidimicrobiaceae bacterium]